MPTLLNELMKKDQVLLESVFSGFDGAVIVDTEGTILLFTEFFAREIGMKQSDIIGRSIDSIFPESRLMEVARTGKPIIADKWELKGKIHIVTRLPIELNGNIIGAVGYNVFPHGQMQHYISRLSSLTTELSYYKEAVKKLSGAKYSLDGIIGQSEAMMEAKERVRRVAGTTAPVLIFGETGTGKELFAHAVHLESPRHDGPMIRVNCASIPESLMESEFFGYEEGAFTGARKGGKAGKFELAHRGSIFLDEVNDLPYAMQAKLLRILQEKEFERVGGTETIGIDVRVISASNFDLREQVLQGRFREDLFYRLNAFFIRIPPLRERLEDLPLLVDHFIKHNNEQTGIRVEGISKEALEYLLSYHWPGNVRELEISIERACLDTQTGVIEMDNLIRFGGGKAIEKNRLRKGTRTLKEAREQAEKNAIVNALKMMRGNKQKAADVLGIHRTSLYYKLREYGMMSEVEE
ncbi:MAG: sigma-54 interaction domain-containing protein [Acidobacteriota bacterium]